MRKIFLLILVFLTFNVFGKNYEVVGYNSIIAHVDQTNTIIFIKNNNIYENEFAGKLTLEASKILFNKSPIGKIVNNQMIVCYKEFKGACALSFAIKSQKNRESHYSVSLTLFNDDKVASDDVIDLFPYVLATPNQEDAGTCLFMATTGAMEVLLNKYLNNERPRYDGMTDISERFLMNASNAHSNKIQYYLTDLIYTFNLEGGAVLNKDYRFTKGYYTKTESATFMANEGDAGAQYGTSYNWIDEYSDEFRALKIDTLKVKRNIIFIDPERNRWNTGIMNENVITNIKKIIKEKKVPVIVIYNHYMYWHAVMIVGYNDQKDIGKCPFTTSTIKYLTEKASKLLSSNDSAQVKRGRRIMKTVEKTKLAIKNGGGCRQKGIFYVRDSIYTGSENNIYDYDLTKTGDETPYSKKIIEKSYDWVKFLGNHALSIESDL